VEELVPAVELPLMEELVVLVVEVLEQEQVVLEIHHHSHQHKEQMVAREFPVHQ
jgi:hypothetical protein